MIYRELGKSGIMVHPFAMGCWAFGGGSGSYWGEQSQKDVDAIVSGALDLGVNFFDTAEYYNTGESEVSLGLALGARRSEAVICTKVTPDNAYEGELIEHCEASLKRLGTDYIDLYLLHWPLNYHSMKCFTADQRKLDNPPTIEEVTDALKQLKQQGKIRSYGVSNMGVTQMEEALSTGAEIDVNQITYNIFSRAIEATVQPFCLKHDISLICTMTLQQGILSGAFAGSEEIPQNLRESRHFSHAEKEMFEALVQLREVAADVGCTMSQLAIAWAIHRASVAAALTGSRTGEELKENFLAASISLTDDAIARIDAISQPVWDRLGDGPDYYMEGEACRVY